MFGHGRAQNVAGVIAATLFIGFTAYQLYVEAFSRLVSPEEASYQDLGPAVGVLVGSILIVAWPLVGVMHQRTRGPAVTAQLVNLVTDELGLVAALVATLFIIGAPSRCRPHRLDRGGYDYRVQRNRPSAEQRLVPVGASAGSRVPRGAGGGSPFRPGSRGRQRHQGRVRRAERGALRDARAGSSGPRPRRGDPNRRRGASARREDQRRRLCMVQVDAALLASAKGGDRRPILAC
jgi:hypothetical protein